MVCFAKANGIEPDILILDNDQKEYYDDIYRKLGVSVTRTRLGNIRHFRAPVKMLKSLFWITRLKFFARSRYASVHIIGFYNIYQVIDRLTHPQRFFWNVNNVIQFPERRYPYPVDYFVNANDTIVCINRFQPTELFEQYGADAIKANLTQFKLFINE